MEEAKMKTCFALCLVSAGLLLAGCDRLESGRRLRLPRGSVENGRTAFISLKCTECHTVAGVELPKPTVAPDLVVELGGDVSRLRTVGDLLTSIIHPTESVSLKMKRPAVGAAVSAMPNVNDTMTVTQLVDLVRFLQPRYSEMTPPMDWAYTL
jgi:sulfur-oxidizing protein SoxX